MKSVFLSFIILFTVRSALSQTGQWQLVSKLQFEPVLQPPFLAVDSEIIFSYYGGQNFRSLDAGSHWSLMQFPYNGELKSVRGSTAVYMYRGARPMISESLDSGASWNIVKDTIEIYSGKGWSDLILWSDNSAYYIGWSSDSQLISIAIHGKFQTYTDSRKDSVLENFLKDAKFDSTLRLPAMMWLDSLHGCYWTEARTADNTSSVIVTIDGGRTWKHADILTPSGSTNLKLGTYGACYNGIYVLQPNGHAKYFYYSTDFGDSWVTLPDNSSFGFLEDVIPLGGNTFIATGWPEGQNIIGNPANAFWITSDAGINWTSDLQTAQYFDMYSYPLIIVDSQHIYARGISKNASKFPIGEYLFRFGTSKLDVEKNETTENFTLYPNPCNGSLMTGTLPLRKAIIFNEVGKKVLELSNPGLQIDLTGLNNGIYLFQATTISNTVLKKSFIKVGP